MAFGDNGNMVPSNTWLSGNEVRRDHPEKDT
jgi:hypothetical protein